MTPLMALLRRNSCWSAEASSGCGLRRNGLLVNTKGGKRRPSSSVFLSKAPDKPVSQMLHFEVYNDPENHLDRRNEVAPLNARAP